MHLGLHISIAGGIYNAPANAAAYGSEGFQMFTRSPRGGAASPITAGVVKQFQTAMTAHHQQVAYVHTPYFVNFASALEKVRAATAAIIREELERSSLLGVRAVMTHLGSATAVNEEAAHQGVVQGLTKTLKGYTGSAQLLLELAAGSGAVLGDTFEELARYCAEVEASGVAAKGSIGICLDTCHAFAAGYDLRTSADVERTLEHFDQVIGLKRLVLIHANDSKTEFGSHVDRHEHIGAGQIGRAGFKALLQHSALKHVDFMLETPHDGKEQADLNLLKKLRA